jgi:hypothetical protein
MRRTVRIALALVALVALVAACSEEPAGPLPSPSSAFASEVPATGPTGSGPIEGTGPTGAAGDLPTTSPGAGTGNLERGSVTFQVSGDLEAERTLRTLVTAVFTPPPGALAIVWVAGGVDATVLGIGGSSFTGTRPTAPTLSITLSVQTRNGIASFTSIDGECDVTIEVATEAALSGSIACDALAAATGEVVDVSASFSATG